MKSWRFSLDSFYKSVYLIILFFLYSCSTNEEASVNRIPFNIEDFVHPTKINYEVAILDIVPLETTPESIFGNIERIEYYHERIYILDVFNSKSLLMFSKQGEFLGKTKYGKGPGEMINPFAFCIDKIENNIIIWDQTLNTLFTFDLDLNLKSKKILDIYISDIAKVDDKFLIQSQNIPNEAYSFIFYSNDFQKRHSTFDFPYESSGGGMYLQRSMSTSDNVYLISPNDYNIYQFHKSSVKSKYLLDFGEAKMIDERMKKENIGNIWRLVRNGTKVSFPIDVFESRSFVGFQVNYKHSFYTYFISKVNGKTFRINDFFPDKLLPECNIRGSIGSEDLFYGVVEPRNILKYKEKKLRGLDNISVDLDKNPFIIFIEIRPK